MQRRTFDILLWSLLIAGGVIMPWLYHQVWMPVSPEGLDKALFERGIATPMLLWLNGYFGTFFNLRYLGNLGWLLVPMLVWALLNVRHLSPWQRGIVALTLLSAAVIGGFGGFNYRYALTLVPLFTIGSLLLLWWAFEHFGHARRDRMIFLGMLVLASGWNTALALEHRTRVRIAAAASGAADKGSPTLKERLDPTPADLDAWLSASGFASDDTILVNNLPEFYYITARPGAYFWCGSDQLFLSDGPHFLFERRTDEQVAGYLLDSLHCAGILSTTDLSAFDARFQQFLDTHCTLAGEDARGYTIHRINAPSTVEQ